MLDCFNIPYKLFRGALSRFVLGLSTTVVVVLAMNPGSVQANLLEKKTLLVKIIKSNNTIFAHEEFCELLNKTKIIKGNTDNVGVFDKAECNLDDLKLDKNQVITISVTDNSFKIRYENGLQTQILEVSEPNIKSLLLDQEYVNDLAFYVLNTLPFHGYQSTQVVDNYVQHNKQRFKLEMVRLVWLEQEGLYLPIFRGRSEGQIVNLISYKLNERILSYYLKRLATPKLYQNYESWLEFHVARDNYISLSAAYRVSLARSDNFLTKANLLSVKAKWYAIRNFGLGFSANIFPKITEENDFFSAQEYSIEAFYRNFFNNFSVELGLLLSHEAINAQLTLPDRSDTSNLNSTAVDNSGYSLNLNYALSKTIASIGFLDKGFFGRSNRTSFRTQTIAVTLDYVLLSSRDIIVSFNSNYSYSKVKIKNFFGAEIDRLAFTRSYAGVGFKFIY